MSNYKPRIESNNLDLTSILSTINDLPEAGSGGSGSGGLETCKLIMSYSATYVIYQPALGEYIYWRAEVPGDSIVGADVLCGSLILGVSQAATVENAIFISYNTWLITAPAGGTVRFS